MLFDNKLVDHCAYLSLGTNLGDKQQQLSKAIGLIKSLTLTIEQQSSIYETEAWGYTNQPTFYNQVIKVHTILSPQHLLRSLNDIERKMGRARTSTNRWMERTIDIDILFYDSIQMNNTDLCIPHPEIENRKFVLHPLVEISPNFIHPRLKKTATEMLMQCTDTSWIRKI